MLVSNSVPKHPANSTGTRGQGSVSLSALCFFAFLISFCLYCLADFPLPSTSPSHPLSRHEQVKFPVAQNRISWCRQAEQGGRMAFLKRFRPALPQARLFHRVASGRGDAPCPHSPRGSPAMMLYSTCPLGPESPSWARKVQTRGPGCPSVTSKGPS